MRAINVKALLAALLLILLAGALLQPQLRSGAAFLWSKLRGGYSVAERVEQFGPAVAQRLEQDVLRAGLSYPPGQLAYVAFKDSRQLEVHARDTSEQPWRLLRRYPILGASGTTGPKLAEGDLQVPEGIYRAEFLNANSRFHLSIRLDYPNAFDRRMAARDGREQLGGDIMIHGNSVSIGCLAMGDEAAEDLFVLAALSDTERLRIVISPTDLRQTPAPATVAPAWLGELYQAIGDELQQYPSAAEAQPAPRNPA